MYLHLHIHIEIKKKKERKEKEGIILLLNSTRGEIENGANNACCERKVRWGHIRTFNKPWEQRRMHLNTMACVAFSQW